MRVVIIGACGHYGYVLKASQHNSHLNIVGISPGMPLEDISRLINNVQMHNEHVKIYEDYELMLDVIQPDIAVVNTYCHVSEKIILTLLERNIHLFVEKPIATSIEGLNRIKEVYKKSDSILGCMFALRYRGAFLSAHKLVSQGKIGKIRLINAQKSYKLGERGGFYQKNKYYGGIISWVGIHAIDWIYYFSNEQFKNVYAVKSHSHNHNNGELEMSALCQFELSNKVFASVTMDYYRPEKACSHDDDRLRIVGTEGVIEILNKKVYLINKECTGKEEIQVAKDINIFEDYLNHVKGWGQCLITPDQIFEVAKASIYATQAACENKIIYW